MTTGESMKVDPEALRAELLISRRNGRMTEEFATLAIMAARMVFHSDGWSAVPESEIDVFMSDFQFWLVTAGRDGIERWHKISMKNPFSYIQCSAKSRAIDYLRKRDNCERNREEAAEIVDNFVKLMR